MQDEERTINPKWEKPADENTWFWPPEGYDPYKPINIGPPPVLPQDDSQCQTPHLIFSYRDRYWRENGSFCGPPRDWIEAALRRAGVGDYTFDLAAGRVDTRPGVPNIIFGEQALQLQNRYGLDAHRGHVELWAKNTPVVHTFSPIDCVDIRDVEGFDDDEDGDDGRQTFKDSAPTARKNYGFWAQRDILKLLAPPDWVDFDATRGEVRLLTSRDIDELWAAEGQTIFADIETHPATDTVQCVAYAIDNGPVISVVIYDHRGNLAPSALRFFAAYSRAASRNKMVYHNGAGFDLIFLALQHRVPYGRDNADTMLMHHRLFPEAEKSLAHCISLYTNHRYHKSEGSNFYPRSWAQMEKLLSYNAQDVRTLRQIYYAELRAAEAFKAVRSCETANKQIYPYITAGLFGMGVDYGRLNKRKRELQARLAQYDRILRALVGREINPESSVQLANYFHGALGYPVVAKTEQGAPSLAGNALYLLLQKHPENPVPRVVLEHRALTKQLEQLTFTPLKLT